jgi:hypothetical protein
MDSKSILANPTVIKLFTVVIDPVVKFIFAAAIFYFIWGVFSYIRKSDDPSERVSGGKHILYGTLGIFIMISVWGIIAVLRTTLGVR